MEDFKKQIVNFLVKKVNFSTCVVYTLIDPRVNIGALESATREYGYVSGDAALYKDGLCKLSGLDASTSVVGGGVVCTSGAGGVFPDGLLIGQVKAVHNDNTGTPAREAYSACCLKVSHKNTCSCAVG